MFSFGVGRFAANDVERYRQGYPGKRDDPRINTNWLFYSNQIPSSPSGALIEVIHAKWFGQYELLERHHGFIQWLFPIREEGLNADADPLQLHEAEKIKADADAHRRFIRSYEMMLDFYGFQLVDRETGDVQRVANYRPRFDNLNYSSHNYLRITRILKCLGELGLEHYKPKWLSALIHEAFVTNELRNVRRSLRDYWIPVVRDDGERQRLMEQLAKVDH